MTHDPHGNPYPGMESADTAGIAAALLCLCGENLNAGIIEAAPGGCTFIVL